MPFDPTDAAELIRIARHVAATEVMPHFRALDADRVATKADAHDLVTPADTAAEAALTQAVHAAFPDALVVGEEAVAADPGVLDRLGQPGRVIVIDPIDGTWNYAVGQANFGLILAVVEDGATVFGLHLDPAMDDWIMAHRGGGAFRVRGGTGHRLKTRAPAAMADWVGFLAMPLFEPEYRARISATMPGFGRVLSWRCAAQEYRLVAEGHAAFFMNARLNPWDHAAGTLIVAEAGGHSALIGGAPYTPRSRRGTLLTAADRATWDRVAEVYSFLADR